MGADAVVVCFGLRFSLGTEDELNEDALEAFERRTDARMVAARKAGLQTYFGKVTSGGEYFLLVGRTIGEFGAEGLDQAALKEAEIIELMARTRTLLAKAGLAGEPELHVQFEAQY